MTGIFIIYLIFAAAIVFTVVLSVHKQFSEYERIIDHQNQIIQKLINQIKINEL